MTHPPFYVAATRAGTCLECGRPVEAKPHGVKLRLAGDHSIATITLCRECFARAIAAPDRGSAAIDAPARRECEWAGTQPANATCGHPASVVARAIKKDGTSVSDLALCDEHFTAFKLWRHDFAITVHRLSAPHETP
jgi:hypothetical protein